MILTIFVFQADFPWLIAYKKKSPKASDFRRFFGDIRDYIEHNTLVKKLVLNNFFQDSELNTPYYWFIFCNITHDTVRSKIGIMR